MGLKVMIESLGCSKNLVDSEIMMGLLSQHHFHLTDHKNEADIIIVNTCGFIEAAKQESIDTIIALGKLKQEGRCKSLIVAGCLAERYAQELLQELPEVDAVIGTGNYPEIIEVIQNLLKGNRVARYGNVNIDVSENLPRILSTPAYTAYLKIAEGCDNYCTYCIIPKLRGSYRSRKMEDILQEAEKMAAKGVKEIILIAQDTTGYGIDLYGTFKLPELLRKICRIDGIEWVRLLYSYPDKISEAFMDVIAQEDKICKYLDLPIQHCNHTILKKMNRNVTKEDIVNIIQKLRLKIPDIHLRTSLIVGFPGETLENFEELMQFVEDMKFDRLGVFTYSQEENTPAAHFKNQVSEEIKKQRRDKIMQMQKEISLKKNREKIGNVYDILVEEKLKDEYMGRTEYDAPEIDGMVYFHSIHSLSPGDLVKVKITDALEYDLLGEMLDESC